MGKNKKKNILKSTNSCDINDINDLVKNNPKYWIIDYIREKKNGIPIELEEVLKNTLDTVNFDEYFIGIGYIEYIKEYFIYQIKIDMENTDNDSNKPKTKQEEVEELSKFLAPMVEHPYFNICFEAIMEYAILQKIKIENNQLLSQIFYNIMDLTENHEIKYKQWNYLHNFMIMKFNKKDYLLFSNKLLLQRFCSLIGFNNIYIDVMKKNGQIDTNEYLEGIQSLISSFKYLMSNKFITSPLVCTNQNIRSLKDDDKSFLRFDLLDFLFLVSFTDTAIAIDIVNNIIFMKLDEEIEKNNNFVLEQFFTRKVSWYNLNILIEFAEIPVRAKFPSTNEIMNPDPFKFTYLDRIIQLSKKNKNDFNNFESDFINLKNNLKKIKDDKYLKYAPNSYKNKFLSEFIDN